MRFDLSKYFDSKRRRREAFSSEDVFSIPTINERYKRVEKRFIDDTPYKILDATGLVDDYYLNLLDWTDNKITIALAEIVYSYDVKMGSVTTLFTSPPNSYVSSLKGRDNKVIIGDSTGEMHIFDLEMEKVVETKSYHSGRITALAFNDKVLSSGDKSGCIYNIDFRVAHNTNNVIKMEGHTQEICGLKWSHNNEYLASGANDNTVRIWKTGSPVSRELKGHESAVKALDWCPWKSNILASGGGTKDKTVRFWDIDDNAYRNDIKPIKSVKVDSQVCTLNYLTKYKEIITGHGFHQNDLKLWRTNDMKLISSFGSHDSRVLHTALAPDETSIVSLSGDGSLKFWKIAEPCIKSAKRDSLPLR